MSTSLAEQLRRLAAPQTSVLVDTKKRPSLLFDQKEAANKDREEIFSIGYAGFVTLCQINPVFLQFEQTLFDRTAKHLERSVESSEVNKNLDIAIKKFLHHLSPYFPIQPAHECLEWLIRRFHIHEFNKNEFLAMIFPYHETLMFVKCVQLFDLKDPNDRWHWLKPIQSPGVKLSKHAVLNRAASDPSFLKFICKQTVEAVKELKNKAPALQAHFAFYCTTVIGALETAKEVTESHVSNILNSIFKGIASNVIDFTAASLMISAQLVSKTKLSAEFLEALVQKLCGVVHPTLQKDVITLLLLIFTTQKDALQEFPEPSLTELVKLKWVTATIGALASEGVNVALLCIKICTACLRRVQTKGSDWSQCKMMLEAMLIDVQFKKDDVKQFIRSVLDSYHKLEPKKLTDGEIIELDSDDESSVPLDADIESWYSNFLLKLETQYAEEFDSTIKETLQSRGRISESRKQALKTVLAFRLKSSYSEDNVPIYENLYHYNAHNRAEAVKYIVKNFEKLSISGNNQNLLKDSVSDRLSDDSPIVVHEALQISSKTLIQLLGVDVLKRKLIDILNKSRNHLKDWSKVVFKAVDHLTIREVCTHGNVDIVFLSLIPFLFPVNNDEIATLKNILSSDITNFIPFLKKLSLSAKNFKKCEDAVKAVEKLVETSNDLPNAQDIVSSFTNVDGMFFAKPANYAYFLIYVKLAYRSNSPPEMALKVLDILNVGDNKFQFVVLDQNENMFASIRKNKIPISLFLETLDVIVKNTQKFDLSKFDTNSKYLHVILTIYKILLNNSFSQKQNIKDFYSKFLKTFLNTIAPSTLSKLKFLSNFYFVEPFNNFNIGYGTQIRSIRLFNVVACKNDEAITIDEMVFVKILISLRNEVPAIRLCSLETLRTLLESEKLCEHHAVVASKLLSRREELSLDHEQLPLVLFTALSANKSIGKKPTSADENKLIKTAFNEILGIATNMETDIAIKAEVLNCLKLFNTSEVIKKLVPVALNVLNNIENAYSKDKDLILDKPQFAVYNSVVLKFEEATVQILTSFPSAWTLLEKSLKLHGIRASYDGQITSLASVIFDNMEEEMYDKIPAKFQDKFIKLVVEAVSFSEDTLFISRGKKLIRRINLNGKHIEPILLAMKNVCQTNATRKKEAEGLTLNSSIFNSPEWKNGITALEFLQNKKKLTNFTTLVPILFDILQKTLEFSEQSSIEYAKQLALSCLLHIFQKLSLDVANFSKYFSEDDFRIDLIVQCIRATQNPQTHHHALLLLTQSALAVPQKVLLNMMDIFTFMGNTLVRHDDAFTFQIISNVIESVVPSLITHGRKGEEASQEVISILKVFTDIILDVPDHRRLPLYIKLLRILDAKKYMWIFLCLLFESHIIHDDSHKQKNTPTQMNTSSIPSQQEELPKRVQIAMEMCLDFEPTVAIETCIRIIEYLRTLPTNKVVSKSTSMEIDSIDQTLFNVNVHTDKQLRHYKYVLIQFVNSFTSCHQFVNRIAVLSEKETMDMKPYNQTFIIRILTYIPEVSTAMEKYSATSQMKYWKVMLHHCYDILDNAISLLSPDMLLIVVHGLMQHRLLTVRKKVLEVLIAKLQYSSDYFKGCEIENFLKLLDPLNEIVDSILGNKEKYTDAGKSTELVFVQHISLILIKLLSRQLASTHPDEFKDLLTKLTDVLKNRDDTPKIIIASLVLCVTEICANLKAHCLSQLSRFMPQLVGILQEQEDILQNQLPDNISISIITGTQKMFETLPLFLSPYMEPVITAFSGIWAKAQTFEERDQRTNVLLNKLRLIWGKIAMVVPLRVLIPACEKSYDNLVEQSKYSEVSILMNLLKESFGNASRNDINALNVELTAFFLKVLEFRSNYLDEKNYKRVSATEESILQSFVALILKLSESSFRPLYQNVYDWALRNPSHKERSITYFALSSKISEALKSLFVLFAADFIQNAAELLDKCNQTKTEDLYFGGSIEKTKILVEHIVTTLNNVFLYDSKKFVNSFRFGILCQPLVDQLENNVVINDDHLSNTLLACISQLALAVADDNLWKQLNYQVLMKTRHSNPKVRILSFKCCVEIVRKLSEDFTPLLPETIPFIAELLEDESEEVEQSCKSCVHEIEAILGDSLQNYF